jgi:hypothetical protein
MPASGWASGRSVREKKTVPATAATESANTIGSRPGTAET